MSKNIYRVETKDDSTDYNSNLDGTSGTSISQPRTPLDPCNIALTLHGVETTVDIDAPELKEISHRLVTAVNTAHDGSFTSKRIKYIQINVVCEDSS